MSGFAVILKLCIVEACRRVLLELPSAEYESQRRRVDNGVLEWWFYFQAEINSLVDGFKKANNTKLVDRLSFFRNNSAEHYRCVPNMCVYCTVGATMTSLLQEHRKRPSRASRYGLTINMAAARIVATHQDRSESLPQPSSSNLYLHILIQPLFPSRTPVCATAVQQMCHYCFRIRLTAPHRKKSCATSTKAVVTAVNCTMWHTV